MKKLLTLPLLALALTACGGSGGGAPAKPVETKTPSYYNPVGIWDINIENRPVPSASWTSRVAVIEITAENVRDNNQWWSYRYFDPFKNWSPVNTGTSIAYGNTKTGEVVLKADNIGTLTCKGAYDVSKNYYFGNCTHSVYRSEYRVAMQRR